jgi:hypothetical protein
LLVSRSHGIEHILNVGTGIENRFPDRLSYTNVELLDLPEQDLKPGIEEPSVADLECFIPDPGSGSENFSIPDLDPNIFSSQIPDPT